MTVQGDATSLSTRKRLAGQRLVIGFDGTDIQSDLREIVRTIVPAGVILFARNVHEPSQVHALLHQLLPLWPSSTPPLRMVDQEGGRVARVRSPATEWPPMRVVGRHGKHTAAVAKAMALELLAMGFDLNLAPNADVNTEPRNPVIGDRAFSSTPSIAAQHVYDYIQAMQSTGLLACAKHFPGHGDTTVDSHVDLPTVHADLGTIQQREFQPFQRAINADVAAMMTAHILFPALDPSLPATLSPHIVPALLREGLQFQGLVLSDDLEMGAIDNRYSPRELAVYTTIATVDLLLMCHDPHKQLALYEALIGAMEHDARIESACRASETRLHQARARLHHITRPDLSIVGCDAHQQLAAQLQGA